MVFLEIELVITFDPDFDPFGKGIHHGSTDAVQTARDLVGLAAEFGARVQYGHHRFQRGFTGGRVNFHGNAAAVILDRD